MNIKKGISVALVGLILSSNLSYTAYANVNNDDIVQNNNAVVKAKKDLINEWAKESYEALKADNIIPQSINGEHNRKITREEFTELLLNMFKKYDQTSFDEKITFKDTNNEAVIEAASLGLINGKSKENFAPNDYILREEIAVIMHRVINNLEIHMPLTLEFRIYNDSNEIAKWANGSIQTMNKLGVIKGVGDNNINPKGYATIDEAVVMIHRLSTLCDEFSPINKEFSFDYEVYSTENVLSLKSIKTKDGNKINEYLNISLENGELLELDDLFNRKIDYRAIIEAQVLNSIAEEKLNVNKEDFKLNDNPNFYISKDNQLVVVYKNILINGEPKDLEFKIELKLDNIDNKNKVTIDNILIKNKVKAPQIKGLKDKSIEDEINLRLSTFVQKDMVNKENIGEAAVNTQIMSVFSPKLLVKNKFTGEGSEYADKTTVLTHQQNNKFQILTMNDGAYVASVYELKDGSIYLINTKELDIESYLDTPNLLDEETNEILYEKIIQGPIEVNNKWTSNNKTKTITSIDIEEVNGKKVEVITILTEFNDINAKLIQKFAEGYGEVSSQYQEYDDNNEIIQTISSKLNIYNK